jgi:5'-3' exonuclease
MKHLLLIDASGFAYRAYHAGVPQHRASDSMPIHAITGFLGLVWRLMDRAAADPYDYAAAVFDAPGRTFRHKFYPQYKAGRVRPSDLIEQLPLMREAARVMGIEPIELAGYEADDVIATLAETAKDLGIRVTISTVDKDFAQLVDSMVTIADPVQRIRMGVTEVIAKFGVEPSLVVDVQTLAGDPVDNIPGVPGIGVKTAAGLIRRFGSLKALLRAIDKRGEPLTPSVRSALKREQKNIPTYRKLVKLKRDVPLHVTGFEAFVPERSSERHRRNFLKALEAEGQYERIFGGGIVKLSRIVDAIEEPYEWWSEELVAGGQMVPEIPQCGFYKRKLAHGMPGHSVARIWREPEMDFLTQQPNGQDILLCEIDGLRKDPYDQWAYLAMSPISRKDYEAVMSKRGSVPKPTGRTDFSTLAVPTFGRKRA